jgi:hypothetical protein
MKPFSVILFSKFSEISLFCVQMPMLSLIPEEAQIGTTGGMREKHLIRMLMYQQTLGFR